MPTISISKRDLDTLLKQKLSIDELNAQLQFVKGEIKEITGDELKIELTDTNRPDLWCAEGIAREIRGQRTEDRRQKTEDRRQKTDVSEIIIVEDGLQEIRPYICGVLAKDIRLDELSLQQLIQTQEKLANLYGHNRKDIAIGVYNADELTFPLYYRAVLPSEREFVPLGFSEELNLNEILERHPKGKEYGYILKDYQSFPILEDSKNKILSFPPVINSEAVGKVETQNFASLRHNLFCDITGTNIEQVILIANILACNLQDRGGEIIPIRIKYPYSTPLGKEITIPYSFEDLLEIPKNEFEKLLGISISQKEIKEKLKCSNYCVTSEGKKIKAKPPIYRRDVIHSVDVIEDFAIRQGYNTFEPEALKEFTVGKLRDTEPLFQKTRKIMVGCGFEEIMSNILTSKASLCSNMNIALGQGTQSYPGGTIPESDVIELENPISESFAILRNSLIPSLLAVETTSSKSTYPHKIFELGEVVTIDSDMPNKNRTLVKLGALLTHPTANFSELHSLLDTFAYYTGFSYELKKTTHPSFINGRVGEIIVNGSSIGLIGEVHPQVLENWKIRNPLVVFELLIEKFS